MRRNLLIGLLAGLGALATVVYAAPVYEVETTYYSTAAKTVEVGWKIHDCSGQNASYGRVTPYFDRIVSLCPVGSN